MTEVREIPGDHSRLVMTVEIPGTAPEDVFPYWTDPALITRWWPSAAEIDARQDGAYHLAFGNEWHLRGRFTEIMPPRTLAFTWHWDHTPDTPERTVLVELDPSADGTRVTVTHGTYADSQADREERQSHIEGWDYFLGRLRQRAGSA